MVSLGTEVFADAPEAGAAGLSEREQEVLSLIADGSTNNEIAGEPAPLPAHGQGAHQRDLPQARRPQPRRGGPPGAAPEDARLDGRPPMRGCRTPQAGDPAPPPLTRGRVGGSIGTHARPRRDLRDPRARRPSPCGVGGHGRRPALPRPGQPDARACASSSPRTAPTCSSRRDRGLGARPLRADRATAPTSPSRPCTAPASPPGSGPAAPRRSRSPATRSASCRRWSPAGALDAAAGLRLAADRGRLMEGAARERGPGGMLASSAARPRRRRMARRARAHDRQRQRPRPARPLGPGRRSSTPPRPRRAGGGSRRSGCRSPAPSTPPRWRGGPRVPRALARTEFEPPPVPGLLLHHGAPFDDIRGDPRRGAVRPVRWRETLRAMRGRRRRALPRDRPRQRPDRPGPPHAPRRRGASRWRPPMAELISAEPRRGDPPPARCSRSGHRLGRRLAARAGRRQRGRSPRAPASARTGSWSGPGSGSAASPSPATGSPSSPRTPALDALAAAGHRRRRGRPGPGGDDQPRRADAGRRPAGRRRDRRRAAPARSTSAPPAPASSRLSPWPRPRSRRGRAECAVVVGADLLSRFTDPERPRHRGAVRRRRRGGRRARPRAGPDRPRGARLRRRPGRPDRDGPRGGRDPDEGPRHLPPRGRPPQRGERAGRRSSPGSPLAEIDLFVYHQANARILRAVGERLGLPAERVVDSHPPLRQHLRRLDPAGAGAGRGGGDARARHQSAAVAAFGAGLTWGATVVEWGVCGCRLRAAHSSPAPRAGSARPRRRALAEAGWPVVVNYRTDAEGAERSPREIERGRRPRRRACRATSPTPTTSRRCFEPAEDARPGPGASSTTPACARRPLAAARGRAVAAA